MVRIFDQPVPNACPGPHGVQEWSGGAYRALGAAQKLHFLAHSRACLLVQENPTPTQKHHTATLPAPCCAPKTAPEGVRLIPASVVIKLSPATPPASTRTHAKTFHFPVHVDVDMVCVVCGAVRIFDQPVSSACPRAARGAGVVWGVTPCVRCGAKGPFPCPFPLCFGVSRSRSLHPQSDPFGPIVCPCGPLGATCEGGCILGSSPSLVWVSLS